MRHLFILGCLYGKAGFWGQVDLGVAITGIKGALLDPPNFRAAGRFVGQGARDTTRAFSSQLMTEFPIEVSKDLLFQFCHGFGVDAEALFDSRH